MRVFRIDQEGDEFRIYELMVDPENKTAFWFPTDHIWPTRIVCESFVDNVGGFLLKNYEPSKFDYVFPGD